MRLSELPRVVELSNRRVAANELIAHARSGTITCVADYNSSTKSDAVKVLGDRQIRTILEQAAQNLILALDFELVTRGVEIGTGTRLTDEQFAAEFGPVLP